MQDKLDGRRKGKIASTVMGCRAHKDESGYRSKGKGQPDRNYIADGTRKANPSRITTSLIKTFFS